MKRYEGKLIIDKLGERGDGLAADMDKALWGRGGVTVGRKEQAGGGWKGVTTG